MDQSKITCPIDMSEHGANLIAYQLFPKIKKNNTVNFSGTNLITEFEKIIKGKFQVKCPDCGYEFMVDGTKLSTDFCLESVKAFNELIGR